MLPGFFEGARNFQITGGTFRAVSGDDTSYHVHPHHVRPSAHQRATFSRRQNHRGRDRSMHDPQDDPTHLTSLESTRSESQSLPHTNHHSAPHDLAQGPSPNPPLSCLEAQYSHPQSNFVNPTTLDPSISGLRDIVISGGIITGGSVTGAGVVTPATITYYNSSSHDPHDGTTPRLSIPAPRTSAREAVRRVPVTTRSEIQYPREIEDRDAWISARVSEEIRRSPPPPYSESPPGYSFLGQSAEGGVTDTERTETQEDGNDEAEVEAELVNSGPASVE